MIPGRSVSSAKSSGVHLKESQTEAGLSATTANILPPTFMTRFSPHCTDSFTCGMDRQNSRSASIFIATENSLRKEANAHAISHARVLTSRDSYTAGHSADEIFVLNKSCTSSILSDTRLSFRAKP